jgi:small subunit ribosomal protein S2
METKTDAQKTIETMFSAGAHFGLGRSRRHPTVAPFVFGTKNRTDIFDLEKTETLLGKARAFAAELGREGKIVLCVGGKKEAAAAVRSAAQALNMPFVADRWIGGTLSNFTQIRKRIDRFEKLTSDREKGELSKYTKRERLLIDKEIASLEKMFIGIVSMKKLPDALFVIDPRHEKNAVKEASDFNIPVIALCGSDCNLKGIAYPIVGNDSSKTSIQFFVDEVTKAYQAAKITAK